MLFDHMNRVPKQQPRNSQSGALTAVQLFDNSKHKFSQYTNQTIKCQRKYLFLPLPPGREKCEKWIFCGAIEITYLFRESHRNLLKCECKLQHLLKMYIISILLASKLTWCNLNKVQKPEFYAREKVLLKKLVAIIKYFKWLKPIQRSRHDFSARRFYSIGVEQTLTVIFTRVRSNKNGIFKRFSLIDR